MAIPPLTVYFIVLPSIDSYFPYSPMSIAFFQRTVFGESYSQEMPIAPKGRSFLCPLTFPWPGCRFAFTPSLQDTAFLAVALLPVHSFTSSSSEDPLNNEVKEGFFELQCTGKFPFLSYIAVFSNPFSCRSLLTYFSSSRSCRPDS